jgi:hypothetical protein
MSIYIGDALEQYLERGKVSRAPSHLLRSCLDSIDAALWLIAGQRTSQSLSMLQNCIELIFKAELERIHPILIADLRNIDYGNLKKLLREDYKKHPKGEEMIIPEFDMEKTITFSESLRRIKDLYPNTINKWLPKLEELQKERNNITHYGTNPNNEGVYGEIVATVAFPFLEELLLTSAALNLEKLILPDIYREIIVARKVYDRLKQEKLAPYHYALHTVGACLLSIYGNLSPIHDGEHDYNLLADKEKEIKSRWPDSYYLWTGCLLCSGGSAFVKVKPITKPTRLLIPTAVECSKCTLNISESDKFLAEYHIGDHLDESAVREFWEEYGDYIEEDES